MNGVRAALYLDFDNVFSGLRDLDPSMALAFAQDPGRWVQGLGAGRRWLVRRCFMNASATVRLAPGQDATVTFSSFRAAFVQAGFEVVDCPPYAPGAKNAADIKMVLDVCDALHDDAPYDEFVIGSGDSDFTPLLARLRAADKRVTVLAPRGAPALLAHADRVVMGADLTGLLAPDRAQPLLTPVAAAPAAKTAPKAVPKAVPKANAEHPAWPVFSTAARTALREAPGPLSLSQLGTSLRASLQPPPSKSSWYGHKSLRAALLAVQRTHPQVHVSRTHAWDSRRHQQPAPKQPRAAS